MGMTNHNGCLISDATVAKVRGKDEPLQHGRKCFKNKENLGESFDEEQSMLQTLLPCYRKLLYEHSKIARFFEIKYLFLRIFMSIFP